MQKGIEIKKLFTIDDFAVTAIAALGYGYGEAISGLFGLSDVVFKIRNRTIRESRITVMY